MKKGFGILEVLVAALVLGFLVVGLTQLQKGNREGVLRIRARDAANFVAQNVLDSLGSVGINSLVADGDNMVYKNENYTYSFEGKPQLDKKTDAMKVPINYTVLVRLLPENIGDVRSSVESTYFTNSTNVFAKSLEATVSWEFKNTTQSITMAKVVR